MRQAIPIALAVGLVFAVIGCTSGNEPADQGKKADKAATKTEGERAATKTEGEKAAAKTEGERAATKTEGERAPTKTEGEKAAAKTEGEKAATKTEGEKAATKTEGEKAATKTEGEKAATKTEGEKAATKTGAGKAVTAAGKRIIRVDCASDADYTDQADNKWVADQVWTEGRIWGAVGGEAMRRSPMDIPGTDAPGIYLTERWGLTGYRFDVPNGKYTVRLCFAETYDATGAGGPRIFTVKLQGKPVFQNVNPIKEAGGFARPLVKEARGVEVADGKLAIEFVEISRYAIINGIEIVPE